MKKFERENHIFETRELDNGKVMLSYSGKVDDFPQGCIWICDDEAEVADMIEAIIDPERYPEDEYQARHMSELVAMCRW